jgi:hypothetical protein
MGGPARVATTTIALVLLGAGAGRAFGWDGSVATVAATIVFYLVGPVLWRWWRSWHAYEERDYFFPFVGTFSTTNNDLALSLAEPLHLYGVRCEVKRADDSIVRAAESLEVGVYGLPGAPTPTFSYPSAFDHSEGSLPQPAELCEATWYVRDARGGEWLLAANDTFCFGEFTDEAGEIPANYRVIEARIERR